MKFTLHKNVYLETKPFTNILREINFFLESVYYMNYAGIKKKCFDLRYFMFKQFMIQIGCFQVITQGFGSFNSFEKK